MSKRTVFKLVGLFIFTLSLVGCYRIDVQQGNVITDEALQQLHKGMGPGQVTSLFGTPILKNIYVDNSMIYVYTFKPGIGTYKQKRLIIYFSHGRVTSYTYDNKPVKSPVPRRK